MADTTWDNAYETQFGDYAELLKPRVMRLVIFTAAVGMFVAPGNVHPVIAFASILCIAVGAGAAGALNMWWDRDIDAIMTRTAGRPIPSGRVQPGEALAIGITLAVMSVVMLSLFANFAAAALLAFTIFFYVVVYSMWLKRATPQNIVIGGAAGAFPPMIGWVVATGGIGIEAVLMFALIFIWTPPHFWALALWRSDDFKAAKIPMLPVTHGTKTTRNNILAYTFLLIIVSMALAFTQIGGLVYFAVAAVLNVLFFIGALRVFRRTDATMKADNFRSEKQLFGFSIFYLFLSFLVLLLEAALRSFDLAIPFLVLL